jgi:hypothetical protein
MLILTFGSGASVVLFPEFTTVLIAIIVVFGALVLVPRVAAAAQTTKVTTGAIPVFKSAVVGTTTLTLGALGAGGASGSAAVYIASGGASLYSLDSARLDGTRGHSHEPPVVDGKTGDGHAITMTVRVSGRVLEGTVHGMSKPEEYGVALFSVTDSYAYLGIVPLVRGDGDPSTATWSAAAPVEARRMLVHVVPRNLEIHETQNIVNHAVPPGTVLSEDVPLSE